MTKTKICCTCHLPDKSFNKGQNQCVDCQKIYMKKYRKKNKKKLNAQSKKYYENNIGEISEYRKNKNSDLKREILSHYCTSEKLECACCKENIFEFLTINHINGGGVQHRKSLKLYGANLYYWLKNNKYPNGYNVLCFNCNCADGAYGRCPHKSLNEEIKVNDEK